MHISLKYHYILYAVFTVFIYSCGVDDTASDVVNPPAPADAIPLPEITVPLDWIKTFGGSNEDNALSVIESTDGNYVIAGYTLSIDGDITDKTATDSDYWILKVSKEGAIIWSKTFGGTGDERAEDIINTTDGGYAVVGYSRSSDEDVSVNAGLQDYWIVKLDANGEILWEKSFGFGGIDRAFSVIQTNDGGFYISGFLDVTASDQEGNDKKVFEKHGVGEFWGIKLDAEGNKTWRRYFGGTDNDRSYDVIQTKDNGFLMIGSSESDDFDILEGNGPKGSYDFWAVKLNPDGTKSWVKNYGGSEIDVSYAITETQNGNFIIVGDSRSSDTDITSPRGNADLWAIQIDGNGNLIWQKSLGGSQFDTGRGIYKTQDHSIIITGNSRSNDLNITQNNGGSDAWILKIDQTGKVIGSATLGGSKSEYGEDCIETSTKNIVVVGSSESNDFDIPTNKGSKDVLIIKYK